MADRPKHAGAALCLTFAAALALPACAQTQQTPQEAARAYLSTLPTGDGEGNLGGQAASETRVAYEFTCRSQRYGLSLTASHPGGSLGADVVRLDSLDQPHGPVADEDRHSIQAELDQFRVVHTVSLRCAGDGGHAFLISGFGRPVEGDESVQPSRTRLLWFEDGQLVRIVE